MGSYGWGRIDMVENRRVGIKSREVYECPGALALLMAHADLEDLTLERDLAHEKARLEPRYAELVYDGLWFSPLKNALDAFVDQSQQFVTGDVRLRCELPGRCIVAGRRSDVGLYDYSLATYEAADRFRHQDAEGFVRLWGLGVATWAARQVNRAARPMTLWQGRFGREGPADELLAYTVSLPYDQRLAADDVTGSRAHVRGLAAAGILSQDDAKILLAALDRVADELASGTLAFQPGDEDVHTAVERRVTEIAGDVGARLHTGRSRNDQVATDLRLFAKRELLVVARRHPGSAARPPATGPAPPRTPICRATPTSSGPSRSCWPTTCWPTAGRWPATSTACSTPAGASTCRRSGPAPWPARRSPSTLTWWPPSWDSRPASRTPSTPCPIGTSWPRPSSTWPSSASTSPGSARRSCCGRATSSASCTSPTPTPPAAPCCRRRRTPTSPSWPGAARAASSAISPACWPRSRGCPLAYNRDLQEDKEPFFDALDQVVRRRWRP